MLKKALIALYVVAAVGAAGIFAVPNRPIPCLRLEPLPSTATGGQGSSERAAFLPLQGTGV